MIFATVGSQMPFDRLMEALDKWAGKSTQSMPILAQTGATKFRPKNMRAVESLSPAEFRDAVQAATVIVAHAGMGSVLTALEFGKPLVVLPRLGSKQETRNDHQVATARWLATKPGIFVAMDDAELEGAINRARTQASQSDAISPFATPALIDALKTFIHI